MSQASLPNNHQDYTLKLALSQTLYKETKQQQQQQQQQSQVAITHLEAIINYSYVRAARRFLGLSG